jgi:hypothetical protein
MRTALIFIGVFLATQMIFSDSYFNLPAPEYEVKYPEAERRNNLIKQSIYAEGILNADLRNQNSKARVMAGR